MAEARCLDSAIIWATPYLHLPANCLPTSARNKLSYAMNPRKHSALVMDSGLLPNWQGFAELAGFDHQRIQNFEEEHDPMKCVLELWTQKKGSTIGICLDFLLELERYDLLGDTNFQKAVARAARAATYLEASTKEENQDLGRDAILLGSADITTERAQKMDLLAKDKSQQNTQVTRSHQEPPVIQEDYDVLIVYADEVDKEDAFAFKKLIETLVTLDNGRHPRVCMHAKDASFVHTQSLIDHLEEAMEHSRFMFAYVTQAFLVDRWAVMRRNALLIKSLDDDNKRWCFIPIYTKKKRALKLPIQFADLKGLDLSRVVGDGRLKDVTLEKQEINRRDPEFLTHLTKTLNRGVQGEHRMCTVNGRSPLADNLSQVKDALKDITISVPHMPSGTHQSSTVIHSTRL